MTNAKETARRNRVLFTGYEGIPDPVSSSPARETGRTLEEYPTAVLSREVAAREASDAKMGARAAGSLPSNRSRTSASADL